MARLALSFLGQFEVIKDGIKISTGKSNKERALLAYLGVENAHPQLRERLGWLLWPDCSQQSALSNLRNILADLRKNIGDRGSQPPLLAITRDRLSINPEAAIWVDTSEFDSAITDLGTTTRDQQAKIQNYQYAIRLYRGVFLEGFTLTDSAPFQEWLLAKREYYNQRILKALHSLSILYEQSGMYESSLSCIQQQLELEPWREEAHQQYMWIQASLGNRSAALVQYEKCRKAFIEEFNVEPSTETIRLYHAIRENRFDGNRIGPGSPSYRPRPNLNTMISVPISSNNPGYRQPNFEQIRSDYLAHLRHSFCTLDFRGIPQLSTLTNVLALEDVYVPILARPELPVGETWERQRLAGRELDQRVFPDEALPSIFKEKPLPPVPVEDTIKQKNRLVILGDPGSGKSTILKHLALTLARSSDEALPILVPLNAYARTLNRHDCNLQSFLPEFFSGRAQGLASLAPLFDDAIDQGQAVILLDGLDEVQSERAALVSKVEDFARDVVSKGNKIIVTSRIVGYREAVLATDDWALYTLLDFDTATVEQFANRWCLAYEQNIFGHNPEATESARKECRALLEAIQSNPGVRHLASNPLLLTILALIKRQGVQLPNSRIKLYDLYLETLIEAWNKARALDKTPGSGSLEYEVTLDVLGPLALRLHQEKPISGLASEYQLLEWLREYFTGEQWDLKSGPAYSKAVQFLREVRQYSNLLVERGEGQYGFIHLTFEEALAAYGLVSAGQVSLQKSLVIIQSHLTDPAWYETIRLALGVWGILNHQPLVAGEVLRAMLQMETSGADACKNILLAGACMEDMGELGSGRTASREVISALETTSRNRGLPPATQRDAGFILGRLAVSNPAFLSLIREDLDHFIDVRPGEFLYMGQDNEFCTLKIPTPYRIGKYPVTNLQFRQFIQDGGYLQNELWSDEGWAWHTGATDHDGPLDYRELCQKRPVDRRSEPFYWQERKWNNPLAPVVGVTWYEAEAYCNWLRLVRGNGYEYRLPTEDEWQWAARGEEGREYAWGNTYDRNYLNTAAFWNQDNGDNWVDNVDVASTTIVGQFPEGRTPCGIYDLCGNVWEWTDSWYTEDRIYRIVRGASWGDMKRKVHCSYHDYLAPVDYVNVIGIRVVYSV